MHSNNLLKECFCLILLCLTGLLAAQTDFRAGYIIDLKNDTLIGDIDYRGDILMGEWCVFKPKNKENVLKYAPKDILGYRFIDDKFFVSREIEGRTVFLEFLIKGKINIYYFRNGGGDHYFIEKEGQKLVELPYKEALDYKDNKMYLNKSTTHIGILRYYMQDAPAFQERIQQLEKPEHDDLIALAKDYHNAVCTNESCIIYKKKIPTVGVTLGLAIGFLSYNNVDFITDKNHFNIGILAHLRMPRVNEKLYFRTGILYSKVTIDKNSVVLYKIPLQIEYIYPKGAVRPTLAYGINVYRPIGVTVGLMVGLAIKLDKNMSLGLNYDIEFNPNSVLPILPTQMVAQTILAGVYIKL
jgi:hypothetical protein